MADYAFVRATRLEERGFRPCQEWKVRTSISVAENGKSYRTAIAKGVKSAVFQVDGEIIKTNQKCDKFLTALSETEPMDKGIAVFIELKGQDVSHAIDQLEATIKNTLFTPYPLPTDNARARIVTANCGPKSSSKSKLEQARIRFKKSYNIDLRVLKNGQPDQTIEPS